MPFALSSSVVGTRGEGKRLGGGNNNNQFRGLLSELCTEFQARVQETREKSGFLNVAVFFFENFED